MKSTYPSILVSIQRAQASGENHWYLLAHDDKQTYLGPTMGPMIPCNAEAVQKQIFGIVDELLADRDTNGPIQIELISSENRVSAMASPRYNF